MQCSPSSAWPIEPLAFVPDGDRMLFTRTDAIVATSLGSIKTDGSDARELVADADWGDWQPPRAAR